MTAEQSNPDPTHAIHNSMDWSYSIRGAQPPRQYGVAGRMGYEPDGSVSFYASEAQMAAWQAEALETGRGYGQIMRYHLVTGVEVQGPDGLVLTMMCQPQ